MSRGPGHGVLGDRDVRDWAFAAGLSSLGDQVWLIALAWTAVRIGGAGLAGVVIASAAVPKAILMLVGGALADRMNLRRLMLGCDVARAGVLVAAFLALQRLPVSAALLIAISVLFGVADAAYTPASGALPVQLVAPYRLVALAGVRQLIVRGAQLAGAPLGGVIVAVGGLRAAVLVDAASFTVIALVLLRMRPRFPRPATAPASLLADLRGGLDYVRRAPTVRDLTLALSGLNVFVTPVIAVGLAELAHRQSWGATRLGVLTGLIGVGAALGTVAALRRPPPATLRVALLSLIVQAAALASLGVDPLGVAALATLTVGLTAGFASPLLAGAFQQTVAREYLGRCNSLVSLSDAALLPLALVGFGWLGAHAGIGVACGLFGAGFAALLGYATLRTARAPEWAPERRSACVDEGHVVGREAPVRADERQPLGPGLGNQQPVKWIAMVHGQACDRETVIGSEAEDA